MRAGRPRRVGTLLVLLGCVALLGGAFAAGLYTGRVGARTPPRKMLDADRDLGAPRARDRARAAEPRPALTFYQELTAPLTAPPPPAKGSPPRPAEPLGEYTVQVGAYKLAEPAEALRATLTAAGWDARVVGAELADGVRYRVQVGAYPTRDAARLAAARLAAERGLPTLVTPR